MRNIGKDGIKSYFARKIIDWNLILCSFKWKKSVIGTGVMYAHIMKMMQKTYGADGVKNLGDVMYSIGLDQAIKILELLGLEKNLEGCAYTLMAAHRIFGIKSKIVHKTESEIVIHVTHCYWGRQTEVWTSGTCASIAQYERGLVEGILPSGKHTYSKKYTLGDEICELVITL